MNIAVVGKFFEERAGMHIAEVLETMGHGVIKIDPEVNFMQYSFMGYRGRSMARTFYDQFLDKIPTVRNFKSNDLYKQFEQKQIDLILVLHDYFTVQEVNTIKKITGAPMVLWFPDAISNFKKSMFFVAGYDHLFFVDKYIVDKLKSEFDLNTHYLPQCCYPKIHYPVDVLTDEDRATFKCDITNAGNFYPSRTALYKLLNAYDIKVWGAKPPVWLKVPEVEKMVTGVPVFKEEKAKAFGAAKIVLNNLHPAVINGVNKRMFEIPACGGFQITSYREAVNTVFEIDKEIVCYNSLADLKEKINFYLKEENEDKRQAIIKASHERVHNEHTYTKRLETIIKIGLS